MPCSEELTTWPCSESIESSSNLHTLFETSFNNIILPLARRSADGLFPCGFSAEILLFIRVFGTSILPLQNNR